MSILFLIFIGIIIYVFSGGKGVQAFIVIVIGLFITCGANLALSGGSENNFDTWMIIWIIEMIIVIYFTIRHFYYGKKDETIKKNDSK